MNFRLVSKLKHSITEFFCPKVVRRKLETNHVVFIDGDQSPVESLRSYSVHTANKNLADARVEFVLALKGITRPPKKIRRHKAITVTALRDFKAGKEAVDKYIAIAAQKAIDEGYTKISVISSDYDFIDIFRMLQLANKDCLVEFTLIAPDPKGRLENMIQSGSEYNQIKMVRG